MRVQASAWQTSFSSFPQKTPLLPPPKNTKRNLGKSQTSVYGRLISSFLPSLTLTLIFKWRSQFLYLSIQGKSYADFLSFVGDLLSVLTARAEQEKHRLTRKRNQYKLKFTYWHEILPYICLTEAAIHERAA